MPPQLSIIVPAFNEGMRLGATLVELAAFADAVPGGAELLIVDDGSRDETAALVDSFNAPAVRLIRLDRNRGKGAALRQGVEESQGSELLLTDADLSTPISAYSLLASHLESADLVLGSRALPDSVISERQPWHREIMGKVFNRLIRWFVVSGFHDTQCGFKLLRGEPGRAIFRDLTIDRFAYDVELVWLARRRGCRVVEVGVPWSHVPESRVHPLRDSSRMLLDALSIRWRHRREPVGSHDRNGSGSGRAQR